MANNSGGLIRSTDVLPAAWPEVKAARHLPPRSSAASTTSSLPRRSQGLPGAAGAVAVVLIGGLVVVSIDLGPLSAHMAHHIGLMNVLAPLVASLFMRCRTASADQFECGAPRLWLATAAQVTLLWGWHLPAAQSWVMASVAGHVAMHGSLFLAALCFWKAVLALSGSASWKSILALLVTGKLACLLGVLLIFAPRLLYLALAGGHVHGGVHDLVVTSSLADQQLAGLLMIAACPLSYLLAGVVIATRMIRDLGRLDYAIASRQQLGPEVVL